MKGWKGTIKELYQMANGQTVRLRTNTGGRALITHADGVNSGDIMVLEGPQDFIGLAIPGPNGNVECYLLPSKEVINELRTAHRLWQETQSDGGNSKVRVIYFDDDEKKLGHGFARRYEQWLLKHSEQNPAAVRLSDLDRVIAEARRIIAVAAGKPESAISISINY
jgi:hypothetical protein